LFGIPALAGPAIGADSPPTSPPPTTYVSGAAVSTLRGPTDFAKETDQPGPALEIQRVSIVIDLYPDVAVIEQVYTIWNRDDAVEATIGMEQANPRFGQSKVLRTNRPLATVAAINSGPLTDENIEMVPVWVRGPEGGPGYRVSVTAQFPKGRSTLNVRCAVKTVGSLDINAVTKPSESGWSYFALRTGTRAWGGSRDRNTPAPPLVVSLNLRKGVELSSLHAEEWTDGARESTFNGEQTIWWRRPTRLVIRYKATEDAWRASTEDELIASARRYIAVPAASHITALQDAELMQQPGHVKRTPSNDPARARRALIVPVTLLLLLALAIFLIRRKRREE
jgi:hypothetical protein